jgi:uncharacterized membrane protein
MEYTKEFYLAVIPFVLINLGLVIWCFADWNKRKKFKYLNKNVWLILVAFVQIIGPVLYLTLARDEND